MDDGGVAWQFHRQMYVDLLCAYIIEYGSRRDVARALGVTEPFVTYLLTPGDARGPTGGPRPLKTPSGARADQLAALLCADGERRAVLLRHIAGARRGSAPAPAWSEAREAGQGHCHGACHSSDDPFPLLEKLHAAATFGASHAQARTAYAVLWRQGHAALRVIDACRQHARFAQVLLFLHETACVLDRADLALDYARRAQLVLGGGGTGEEAHDWLALGAARAEVVALNNLGLAPAARQAALHVEQTMVRGGMTSALWLPHLYRDRLTSLRRIKRFAISEAEILYDRAAALAADGETQVLLEERVAGALLAHGTPRSLRKARPLIERGLPYADGRGAQRGGLRLGPLHRAQLLRTATLYAWKVRDQELWTHCLRRCLRVVTAAGLTHQRRQLERQYGAAALQQAMRT